MLNFIFVQFYGKTTCGRTSNLARILRMRSHAPFEPIVTNFSMWGQVGDVITDAKFYGNRLRGFGVTGPPQTPFPILNAHRPYNSVSTTVLHCDYFS